MNQKLLALYGLQWNLFTSEVPIEALHVPPKVENFCWRIEQAHLREGGFALIQGDPGTGKSVVMRLLAERLSRLADLSVGVIHIRKATSPTFIASSAISSPSPSASATAGAGSKRCAHAGSITWSRLLGGLSSSLTRPRK
jgi:type II secretory pathway predicted ATPase ExeA